MDDGGLARRETKHELVEQPVRLSCAGSWPNACTDEEFGGYYPSLADARRQAHKHPHDCQILAVSIEDYREAIAQYEA